MDCFLSEMDSKIISFPVEEYINTYKEEPESFEMHNVIAQALGCFCFCIAASEIFKNFQIKPSFKYPVCDFIYRLSDFEKKYLKTLSIVRKNKLFSLKNYVIDLKNKDIISGKAFIHYYSFDEDSIKLNIKLDLEKIFIYFPDIAYDTETLKATALENMNILFNSIWSKLQTQVNKSQKAYTQKTLNHIPYYLKFATAPFIHELRRLMTSEKDKTSIRDNNIISEKHTNTGYYIFKHTYSDCEQKLNTEQSSLNELYKTSDENLPFPFQIDSALAPQVNEELNTQIMNHFGKMNDLTVDVLNGVVHILLEKAKIPDQEILLSIDDLLFIRGKQASKNQKGLRGGYKDSQRKEIIEHLVLLSNLKIEISNAYIPVIDNNGKRSYEPYTGESPIIYLKKAENKDYYFYVKSGEVLAITLRGVAAKTGLIHKQVAQYDHYRNFWEKRIGNYLAWIWRSRQNKADFLVPMAVETLLNQVGEIKRNKRPQAIRTRMENALYKLEDDCVIRSWQYKDIDESILTGKNWFENWLKHKLIIEPPVEIFEEYSKIKKIKKNSSTKFDFEEIIKIIKEKKLSQITIAEETNIKHEVLSAVLSGKVSPNLSEKRKLQNWINKQKG